MMAADWLSKAQRARLKPYISTCTDACAKPGDELSKAQEAALTLDIITYNAIIDAYAKSGDKENI